MSDFPLNADPVAVVGSRYGSPFGPGAFALAVVRAGGQVVTGCAAGVDSAAAAAVAGHVRVIRAESPAAWALAKRTGQVVAAAAAVAVFPPASGVPGKGSALALRLALARGVPVFVAGPVSPAGAGWSAATVGGCAGWLHVAPPAMPRLI